MRVRAQGQDLSPARELAELSSVVVYDDYDQPILIVQKLEDGAALVSRCTDPDFNKLASALGIGLNASCKVVAHG
jgi:hypothetical protein